MSLAPVSIKRHILLVEDNPGDIHLIKESFRNLTSQCRLSFARDGEEAIDFLYGLGRHIGESRPDLILLDLNLPKINGHAVLAHLKSSADFQSIPVVVLSSSNCASDVEKAYSLSANCYLCKPGELDQFFHLMQIIQEFWIGLVTLPKDGIEAPRCARVD